MLACPPTWSNHQDRYSHSKELFLHSMTARGASRLLRSAPARVHLLNRLLTSTSGARTTLLAPFRPLTRAAPAASGGWRTALTSRPAGRRAEYRGLSFDGWISPERLYCVRLFSAGRAGQSR